jgi:secreted PhoX family phosphatase
MNYDDNLNDDGVCNESGNRPFTDVLQTNLSRRAAVAGSLATAATTFFAAPALARGRDDERHGHGKHDKKAPLIGFTPVPVAEGTGPVPKISADYQFEPVLSWGDELYPGSVAGVGARYDGDPSRRPTAAEQALLIGIGHDGMTFFPRRFRGNTEGMLCLNHEFGNNFHVLGKGFPASLDDVRVSQHAHGVAVIALKKMAGKWQTVYSEHSRRIHVNTPVAFSGPVAGHALLQNAAHNEPQGTVNNCSNGQTPWGTYLTCEENFNGYFGSTSADFMRSAEQARYGIGPSTGASSTTSGYGWCYFDDRFDLANPDYANEANRFGWVVEIDPHDGTKKPVKRTALGRFKHEGAEVTVGRGGRAVVYMGDDQTNDYIYKFVSAGNWKSMIARKMSPLDHGKLYVAKFHDDGTGEWMELTIDNPVLAARFKDQAEVLVYARIAADLLGATPMDRPEWASVAPNGDVYVTLTNNSGRTVANGPNPLTPNPDGHIIRFRDADRHVGTTFTWEIFLIAQDTHGPLEETTFSDPDGLWCDPDGRVFIQTDGGQKKGLNNQMLVADAKTREIRRLFTGVTSDEITGIAYTPDRRTMFVNSQHPGNGDPTRTNYPAPQGSGKIPRDTTFVITRKNGGIVGS